MSWLKKANIGLILFIVAVIGVTIYCVIINNDREKSKDEVKNACQDFINLTSSYAKLPEENQTIGVKKSDINLSEYYNKMLSDLKEHTTSEGTASIQQTELKAVIESQLYDTSSIVTDFDRQIVKIQSYQYSDDEVTVSFNSRITIKQKYNDLNIETGEQSEKIKEKSYDIKGESITLKKVDGNWKVVYANLAYSSAQMGGNTVNLLNYSM